MRAAGWRGWKYGRFETLLRGFTRSRSGRRLGLGGRVSVAGSDRLPRCAPRSRDHRSRLGSRRWAQQYGAPRLRAPGCGLRGDPGALIPGTDLTMAPSSGCAYFSQRVRRRSTWVEGTVPRARRARRRPRLAAGTQRFGPGLRLRGRATRSRSDAGPTVFLAGREPLELKGRAYAACSAHGERTSPRDQQPRLEATIRRRSL